MDKFRGIQETAKDRNGKIKMLAVDHSHKNGKVRGLLCQRHNIMIGHCDDSIDILIRAMEYLV